MQLLKELTLEALLPLESITRELLFKMVEIQHQVRYICTSIHTVMMKNLLLVNELESCMKNIKKYYKTKHKLNLMLINGKHIIKQRKGKRKEGYMVLELKQKYFMDQIFVSLLDLMLRAQYYVQMLKQHRHKMWMS
ncbi:hypothetical protein R3W88_031764 [Solanum pinnatisectum]|uniref:Uncharacterized protein n=1 Tax=Solanum pinnatisectum TaxID=50273 RepID=A0AAV9LMA4_9SOLN|nr:hypothetical protein R3W88_031764 [Solanum pinnatisectum]